MSTKGPISLPAALALGAALLAIPMPVTGTVVIDYVEVGAPGNAADPTNTTAGMGTVADVFSIAKYEVTNAQYAEFLNAVDPTGANTLQLYNTGMGSNARGGINFVSAAVGGSKYQLKTGYGNMPVVRTSFYDAIRFVNWLSNGQGNGSTESGAYTLLGGGFLPSNGTTVTRNPGATIWIPSESEWYKAAYYQPATAGGDADNYWDYATGSNIVPNSRPSNDFDPNSGNFFRKDQGVESGVNGGYAMTGSEQLDFSFNYLTDVGAYSAVQNYWGTSDMAGGVSEWTESIGLTTTRHLRGGNWSASQVFIASVKNDPQTPDSENSGWGFRVAASFYQVPEPQSPHLLVAAFLSGAVLWSRHHSRRRGNLQTCDGPL